MKKQVFTLTLLVIFTLVSGLTVSAETKKKSPAGTWHYNVANAPYGYEAGDLVIKKEKGTYKGALVFSEDYSIDLYDIKVGDGSLSFKAFVEGAEISFEGTYTRKSIKGTITYSEGTLSLTADRKKKK
ncbi:MAG: hypothetical protein GXO83_13755 [Chlorobi bacterium]|nr:hypothetical protein [Chlorobiota bacterium]